MYQVSANPATPQPKAPRNLWPSPSFSDYFSGDEHATPAKTVDFQTRPPVQDQLIVRLHHIANQIENHDFTGEAPSLLTLKLDELEQALNAPQSQSRSPAEQAEIGLFDGDEADEEDEDETEVSEVEDAAHEPISKAVVDRITAAQEQLQLRVAEVKHINALATARIERDKAEIQRLKSENEDFHSDLSDIHSIMLLLKMQLKAIEVQAGPHMDDAAGDSMRADIDRWKMDWQDVDARLKQRRHLYQRRGSSSTSLMDGNGMSSSSMHLTIARPGLIHRVDSDPFVDYPSSLEALSSTDTSFHGKSFGDEEACTGATRSDSPMEQRVLFPEKQTAADSPPQQAEDSDVSDLESSPPPPGKTPWQELWDSLADYAGIMEYD